MNRTIVAVIGAALVIVNPRDSIRPPGDGREPVTEWSVAASAAAEASGMAPVRVPISLAMLHVAMDDAISGNRAIGGAQMERKDPVSARAAAIEAGYRIMLAEFPSQQTMIRTTYDRLLAGVPDSAAKRRGLNAGAPVARRLLARRANDGRNDGVPYAPRSGPGAWAPTPPAHLAATTAFLARITPFTMDSPSQFRRSRPPALSSKAWADDYNEVKALGGRYSRRRTSKETQTALFWEPIAGTVWPATIRRLAVEQSLDTADSARFQAAAFAAFADGLIACWDAKYHFNFWRPVTAIRAGDSDGNDRTSADPLWEPLATTPNFPEYPSGHACVTAAVAHTIEDFFGGTVAIPVRNIVTGEERLFTRARDIVDEVVEARMLLGLHFRSGDADGAAIGRCIARQIRHRWRRPTPGSSGRSTVDFRSQ